MPTLFDTKPETKPARPKAVIFDPAEWIVLPNGEGLHRSDLAPCKQCGGLSFEYRVFADRKETADGVEWIEQAAVQCPKCMPLAPMKTRNGVTVRKAQIAKALIEMRGGTVTLMRDRDYIENAPQRPAARR